MRQIIEKYLVEFVLGTFLAWFYNLFSKFKKRSIATQSGVSALLRCSIITIYNKYNKYEGKGWMPLYEKENLNHLFEEYQKLGGNGVVEKLYEELMDLPTSRSEE